MQSGQGQTEGWSANAFDTGGPLGDGGRREAKCEHGACRADDEPGGEPGVRGRGNSQRGQRGGKDDRHQNIKRPRSPASRCDQGSKQMCGGNIPSPGDRPDREGQCRQQPEGGRHDQRCGEDPGCDPDRHDLREQVRGGQGEQGAQNQSCRDAETGQSEHLEEIHPEHQGPRGTDAFQGGDRAGLAVEPGPHRVSDSDPAHQQSGQSDEGEEQGDPPDQAGQLG